MDESFLPRLIILFVLLVLSAFFAACEAAFFSLSSIQLNSLKESQGRRGLLVNDLLAHPKDLLITIYIGNEVVNVAVAAVTTSIALKIFGNSGVAIAIGLGTFLILLFGEIVPKTLALKFSESYALSSAFPLHIFSRVVQPIQRLFSRIAGSLITLLGINTTAPIKYGMTEQEFRTLVELGEGEGVLHAEEREMIHNVIEFGDTTAGEIMTPKIDMFTISAEEEMEEILPQIMKNFYSRVPVIDQDGESIAGILYTKDLNRHKNLPREKFKLKSILHPALFIPESKKIKELLDEFKKQKKHLAIVLDEYGSVSGLVTLEDIVEELVGEIDSEMRMESDNITQVNSTTYNLSSKCSLSEFNSQFSSELPEKDFDTVGGFVFDLFGRVPRFGETATHGNFKFQIQKMKGPRIMAVQLSLLNHEAPSEVPKPNEEVPS